MKKQGGKIKAAKRVNCDDGTFYLEGIIFDDPRFNDGDEIRTSTVLKMNESEVETLNTMYTYESTDRR